jgi:hypothetical protein
LDQGALSIRKWNAGVVELWIVTPSLHQNSTSYALGNFNELRRLHVRYRR